MRRIRIGALTAALVLGTALAAGADAPGAGSAAQADAPAAGAVVSHAVSSAAGGAASALGNDWEVRELLKEGIACQRQGGLDGAVSIYKRCLELDGQHLEAMAYLALALDQQGKPREALRFYSAYLAAEPDDDLVRYNAAAACVHAGLYGQALEYCGPLLERHHLGQLFTLAGAAELGLRHNERAVEYLRQAAALLPRSCQVQSDLGAAYLAQGQLREAKECLRRALSLDPRDGAALNNAGVALEASGKRDLAALAFQEAAKGGLAAAEVNSLALACAEGRSGTVEAAECADRYPEIGQARLLYVWMMMREGRRDEAAAELERWQDGHEEDRAGYPYLGAIYYQSGRWELALEQYRKWLAESETAEAHYNASLCLAKLQRPDEAEAEARQACALGGERPELLYNLARRCEAAGKPAEARRLYERAAERYPSFIDAQLLLRYCRRLPRS